MSKSNISNTDNKARIHVFDFIRAFSFIGIFLVHSFHGYSTNVYKYFDLFSMMCMFSFFFTSGYVIFFSLERCNWKQFTIKRIFRLLPVLWLIIFITIIGYFYFQTLPYTKVPVDARTIFANMFMIQDVFHIPNETRVSRSLIYIPSSWSLSIELRFYIISAIAFAFIKNNKHRLYGIILLNTLFSLSYYYIPFRTWGNFGMCFIMVYYIIVGSVFYCYKNNDINKVEFAFFLMLSLLITPKTLDTGYEYNSMIIGFCFLMLIFCIKDEFWNKKIIKFFSNISYSFYLLHSVVIYDLRNILNTEKLDIKVILISFFSLIFICHFIYKYIEKPAYNFGRKLADKLK